MWRRVRALVVEESRDVDDDDDDDGNRSIVSTSFVRRASVTGFARAGERERDLSVFVS